jgi:O-antigen/teichoic acid export membrane protein
MLRETGLRPSARAARDLRRFGVPYQFVTAGTFILTFGDRAFLQAFHGLTAVGLYGLAYQFGFILINATSAPFFRAWAPQRLHLAAAASRDVRDERYNQAFRWLNVITVGTAVAMSLFAWPLLAVMSDPSFRPAARLVPVILLAFLVQIWTDVVSLGIEVSERTRFATYATWVGVVAILALYAVLIPPLAGLGAALATLGGFLARFACFAFWSQRLWPVSWRWGQALALAAAGIVAVSLSLAVPTAGLLARIGVASALLLAFAGFVWAAVLSTTEKRQLLAVLRAPAQALSGMKSA